MKLDTLHPLLKIPIEFIKLSHSLLPRQRRRHQKRQQARIYLPLDKCRSPRRNRAGLEFKRMQARDDAIDGRTLPLKLMVAVLLEECEYSCFQCVGAVMIKY